MGQHKFPMASVQYITNENTGNSHAAHGFTGVTGTSETPNASNTSVGFDQN
jgi:hypothetical protein